MGGGADGVVLVRLTLDVTCDPACVCVSVRAFA